MQGQCRLSLLAGFETTATGLSFLSYELAMNPDVQDKLRAEVDEYFPDEVVQIYILIHINLKKIC